MKQSQDSDISISLFLVWVIGILVTGFVVFVHLFFLWPILILMGILVVYNYVKKELRNGSQS